MSDRNWHRVPVVALAALCAACGGGGSVGSPTGLVTITAPASTPTPTPVAAPTPTPSPAAPRIAGALPGQTLTGVYPCGRGTLTRDMKKHVTNVALTGTQLGNQVSLTYRGIDSYALDINGFGGGSFAATDKQPWSGGPYDQFLNPDQGEFFLLRSGPFGSATFATLGVDTSLESLCFIALGLPLDTLPLLSADYGGRIDGLAQVGSRTMRLYNSEFATIQLRPDTAVAVVELRLVGRDDPFGDFMRATTVDIATVRATITYDSRGYFRSTPLTGGGFTGVISGQLIGPASQNVSGRGGAGIVLEFSLTNAQGDMAFGVVAAEANLI